jgi:hypothetical protein
MLLVYGDLIARSTARIRHGQKKYTNIVNSTRRSNSA